MSIARDRIIEVFHLYAAGNIEAARRHMQAQADYFADRGSTFEEVAGFLQLPFDGVEQASR